MSWNGNDLFNSTLMGGMPSGADPHQYLTTDGNGKPHWEDKLAYDENKVVEIIPPTEVGRIWYGYVEVDCPNSGEVKVGDAGVMYINGEPHKYTATEQINLSGPPVIVQLDVEGVDTSLGKIGLNSSKKLVFHNIPIGSADTNNTISLTKESYTLKTIDPKYLPSGIGKPGVIYLPEFMGATSYKAYRDTGLTEQMTYAEAKEQLLGGALILQNASGTTSYYTPLRITLNEDAKTIEFTIHIPMSVYVCTMTFSDTPES